MTGVEQRLEELEARLAHLETVLEKYLSGQSGAVTPAEMNVEAGMAWDELHNRQ